MIIAWGFHCAGVNIIEKGTIKILSRSKYSVENKFARKLGPMTPYTSFNIVNIHNIDLIPTPPPPQYLLTPVNIYEFLLPP